MFIINSFWYKYIFEPTLSLSSDINFFENVNYSSEFGSLIAANINFYENITETSVSSFPDFLGIGTYQDPYLIYSASQFIAIPNKTTYYYRIMEDLDFTGLYHAPKEFYGYIDGQNHVLSNLNISSWHYSTGATTGYVGLFGYVQGTGNGGIIRNIILDNAMYNVSGSFGYFSYFGGIVGRASTGTRIYNCHIRSSSLFSTGNSYSEQFGGIVGYIESSNHALDSCSVVNTVLSCSKVSGTNINSAGIIVGQINATMTINKTFVQSCSIDHRRVNYAEIKGAGFKGGNTNQYIYDCYMKDVLITGNATASWGVTADGMHANGNYAIRSYAVVTASIVGDPGKTIVQGFCPISSVGTSTSSFYNVDVMGYVSGSGGPKTTAEMLNQDTYIFSSSWDFDNIWMTGSLNGGYPYLRDNPPPY